MAETVQCLRGMSDFFPEDLAEWQFLERTFAEVAANFGYGEVRTPILEPWQLFVRTSGDTSDIVSKEMYEFETRDEDESRRTRVALRPELTAPVMRALIDAKRFGQGRIQRFWYAGPIFRYAEVKSIRRRQGHQFGCELVGAASVDAEVEVIEMTHQFFEAVGLPNRTFEINAIGRPESRVAFAAEVLKAAEPWIRRQIPERQAQAHKNPLRLLDSKEEDLIPLLADLPPILRFLPESEQARFEELKEKLTRAGVPFTVRTATVRGLDYYTGTVFEVVGHHLNGSSLCGGGRYDDLIADIGGPATPSVGVGIGIERVIVERAGEGLDREAAVNPEIFFVNLRPEQREAVETLVRALRRAGIRAAWDVEARSSKSQMRQADASGAPYMAVVGESEVENQVVAVKRLADGFQEEVPWDGLVSFLRP